MLIKSIYFYVYLTNRLYKPTFFKKKKEIKKNYVPTQLFYKIK